MGGTCRQGGGEETVDTLGPKQGGSKSKMSQLGTAGDLFACICTEATFTQVLSSVRGQIY